MRLSKPVIGELADMRSARNGDYRILVRFDDAEHVVWVIRADHRVHIYETVTPTPTQTVSGRE